MALRARHLDFRDFDLLWGQYVACRLEERQGGPANDDFDDPEVRALQRNRMERAVLEREFVAYGVFDDELLVGSGMLGGHAPLGAWRRGPVYVVYLYVLPEYRHAATLPLCRVAWCEMRTAGVARVQAAVAVRNEPQLLRMESAGFEPRAVIYEKVL